MKKEHVIQLIEIGTRLDRKIEKSQELIGIDYWYLGHRDIIEDIILDILGIPVGFDRDDFHGIRDVYTGFILPEEFIKKTENISDPLIKPSDFEILKRLILISGHIQHKVKTLEEMLDAKINLFNEVICDIDNLSKRIFEEPK